MKILVLAAPVAAAAALIAMPAAAATFVDPWTTSPTGNVSVVFGDNGMDVPGAETIAGETVTTHDYNHVTGDFTDTFTFSLPNGIVGFTLSSIGFASNDSIITLSNLSFNGHDIHFTSTGNGAGGFTITGAGGPFPVNAGGSQVLTVAGNAGPDAVFDGTATFRPAAAGVPEPATWALMIAGFGGAGAVLRRRRIAVA